MWWKYTKKKQDPWHGRWLDWPSGTGLPWWTKISSIFFVNMMMQWHGNTCQIVGPLWANLLATGGFPSQRTSNAELWCFRCCQQKKLCKLEPGFNFIYFIIFIYIYLCIYICACIHTKWQMFWSSHNTPHVFITAWFMHLCKVYVTYISNPYIYIYIYIYIYPRCNYIILGYGHTIITL